MIGLDITSGNDTTQVRRIKTWHLAVLVFVVGVARYAPFIQDPWDNTLASINGAFYTSNIVRSFRELGLMTLHGRPHLFVAPMAEPFGVPYVHHPPLWFWLCHGTVLILGWSEASFRVLPIALSAAAAALLFILLARYRSRLLSFVTALLFLSVPMSFLFGWMPLYEPGVLFCLVLGFTLHDALRSASPGRWSWVLLPCFLAPQFDWQGCFLGPGLLVFEMLCPRGHRRWRRVLFLAGPVALLSVVVVLLLNVYWEGSIRAAVEHLRAVANVSMARGWSTGDWLKHQAGFWVDLFTWPVAILAVVGLLLAPAFARRDVVARLTLGFFISALLNIVVFTARSYDHRFWWFTALPAVALGAVFAVGVGVDWSRLRLPFAVLLVLGASVHAGIRAVDRYLANATTLNRDIGTELNSLVGPNDVLLFPVSMHCVYFYLKAWPYGPTSDPATFLGIAKIVGKPGILVNRVVFVSSSAWGSFPELEALLPKLGKVERLVGPELRSRMPVLAEYVTDITVTTIHPN